MADNEEWELPGKKGKKAMKEAAEAKAAEKAKREAMIKQLREMIRQIYMEDNPAPEMTRLMVTSIDSLKSMGENTSMYADYVTKREERLAEWKARADKMKINKAEVNAYFREQMRDPDEEVRKVKNRSTERVWGSVVRPSNAEVYAAMAARIRREKAEKEEIERERHHNWQRSYYGYYGRNYSTGRPQSYAESEYNRYASAAQGGPAPRAQAPPPENRWKQRAAQGAYEEWAPPKMYKILGVPVTASIKNIKKAYRDKVVTGNHRHPNKGGDEEKFKKLQDEYEKALAAAQEGGRRRTKKSRRGRSKTRKNRS
jgi:hypothetical protein